MLEKIIDLLNVNDWWEGDEYVQIAKGKYAIPKNLKEIKEKAIRIIKTK
jgi:hypothetical protein